MKEHSNCKNCGAPLSSEVCHYCSPPKNSPNQKKSRKTEESFPFFQFMFVLMLAVVLLLVGGKS